ncbi:MAG: hypothetical protein NW237_14620 [Cyanobacteriota bacterium]|nr:hypothetical protein [Cyanobacteriota bacterium]
MNIYILDWDANPYNLLNLESSDSRRITANYRERKWLYRKPIKHEWIPCKAYWVTDEEPKKYPLSDFPGCGGRIAFSQNAVNVLEDLLIPSGELLPIITEYGTYYCYNVTNFVDALDTENSEFDYYYTAEEAKLLPPGSYGYLRTKGLLADRSLGHIINYKFHPDLVKNQVVFRMDLHHSKAGLLYVSDVFVERIQEHGLLGFAPKLVWSSDE